MNLLANAAEDNEAYEHQLTQAQLQQLHQHLIQQQVQQQVTCLCMCVCVKSVSVIWWAMPEAIMLSHLLMLEMQSFWVSDQYDQEGATSLLFDLAVV